MSKLKQKILLATAMSSILVASTFAATGIGVWAGYGFHSNNINTSSESFTFKKNDAIWGMGASYMLGYAGMKFGIGASYLQPANTTISTANYLWTYKTNTLLPIEAIAAYNINNNLNVQLDAGLAYIKQSLNYAVPNPPSTPPPPSANFSGTTTGWKPVLGAAINYHLPMGVGFGVMIKHVFAGTPTAFTSNLPVDDDKGYRTIMSQTMALATLSYQF